MEEERNIYLQNAAMSAQMRERKLLYMHGLCYTSPHAPALHMPLRLRRIQKEGEYEGENACGIALV